MNALQVHMVVPIQHRNLGALGAEDQGAGRNAHAMGVGRNRQGGFGVVAGQQFAVGVVGNELGEQGAGAAVDGGGVADQACLEMLAGVFGHRQFGFEARMDDRRVVLRHRYVEAQLVGVGNVEQLRVAVGIGLDQLADIGVAGGDGAGERRTNGLVAFQRRQPRIVRRGGLGVGLGGGGVGGFFIGLLARYRMAGQQVLPTGCAGGCQACIRLLLDQPRMGLGQLLIEVGAVDFGQDLPGLDLAADIDFPVLQVAADPCMDRRLAPGVEVRGQAQGVTRGILPGLKYHHLRDSGGLGPGGDRLFVQRAGVQAAGDQQGGQRQAADTHEHQTLARGFLIRRHVRFLQLQRE